jgi:hypothetical protein
METVTVDNQTIDMKQLEEATNSGAQYVPSPEPEQPVAPEVPEGQAPVTPAESTKDATTQVEVKKETPVIPQGQSSPELKTILDDTPYKGDDVVKSVTELAKGYKELQGRDTQLSQKVKPFEGILDRANRDTAFAEYIRLAEQMYTNPAVAQQYAQPQFQKPDPRSYDWNDAEQIAKYNQDLDSYFDLKVDSKLSSRFAQSDQQSKLEGFKNDFRGKFKDVSEDLDQMLSWAHSEAVKLNPYETSWKLKNWDNREAQLTEKIRKELTTRIEQAQNATPTATPAVDQQKITQIDVGKHIAQYGQDSAEKKFGKDIVFQALRDLTNA